jgi:methylthioribose-1-phosphate isomerase
MSNPGTGSSPTLEAIRYSRGSLQLLDQLLLPGQFTYLPIESSEDGWRAIKQMNVRGAPAIAIAAVLSLAVECVRRSDEWGSLPPAELAAVLSERLSYLRTSRPTAVNLFNETERLAALLKELGAAGGAQSGREVMDGFIVEAEKMLANDVADNLAIGRHGATAVLAAHPTKQRVAMLHICNTGSLATARYGTALGVIRRLHELGALSMAYAVETRPYNQGSRLTAFELVYERIPATLLVDSAAAALMAEPGRVDAVVAGADRVAANGDTANKIGTYALAVLARHHGIPFYIASPFSTLDVSLASGAEITIEEREPTECVGRPRLLACLFALHFDARTLPCLALCSGHVWVGRPRP